MDPLLSLSKCIPISNMALYILKHNCKNPKEDESANIMIINSIHLCDKDHFQSLQTLL